jgi:Ca-activated chloride channel family protein
VLAFDTSPSMTADDFAPTRMDAAKKAARAFIQKQPAEIRIGVVAFSDTGLITQRPTTDRSEALTAIDRLTPATASGTALARGIQTSLSAIAGKTVQLDDPNAPETTGPNLGFYHSAAVVLLSDGENTGGPDPNDAAGLASTAGVKVYPIGIGTPEGAVITVNGLKRATELDEAPLKQIAATTDGRYFNAADEQSLSRVYDAVDVDLTWTVRGEQVEVTAVLAAVAALLLVVGAGLSLAWYGRVI